MARRRHEAAAAPVTTRRSRPRPVSEQHLITLVRRGDLAAFEVLYDRHARELLTFCNGILGSAEDAEDAVQATFALAYRALIADERKLELRPWLFAIARNASLSILRKRRPTRELREHPAANDDPAARAEQHESLREAVVSLQNLPERQRTALVLAELHGFSHAEIADALDDSPERVKSYVFQARSSMISERSARTADCAEIREELAGARGAQLLKGQLRRHLRSCEGCREFLAAIRRRRGQLGVLLPIAPTLALKRRVIGAASSCANDAGACARAAPGAGAGAAATTAELIGVGAKGLVAKLLIGAVGLAASTGAGSLALGAGGPPGARSKAGSEQARGGGSVDPAARARNVDGFSKPSTAPGATARAALPFRTSRAAVSSPMRFLGTAGAQRAEDAGGGGGVHGKSAESHGNGSGSHGKSSEAHGKSAEAHGKSGASAHEDRGAGGASSSHGKSAGAHRNEANGANRSAALGESSKPHGDSAPSRGDGAGPGPGRPNRPDGAHAGGVEGEHASSAPAARGGAGASGKDGAGAQASTPSASGEQAVAQPPARATTSEGSSEKGQAVNGEPPADASEGKRFHKP